MAKTVFKGFKKVIEGSFTADTGYMYFVRKQGTNEGYLQFNGREYGKGGLPAVTSSDNLKVLQVRDASWEIVQPLVVYSGSETTPPDSFGNDGDVYLQTTSSLRAPVVVYETNGASGLLGHNNSDMTNQWQLENLDLTPYNYIRCYFAAGTATGDTRTPAVVVEVPLDAAAVGPTGYIGSIMTPLPFNRNREYMVSCAVDTTKTKFQVIHQNTLWDITTSDANSAGRYCYKIEGWY
jgi:hypothetical protein